MSTTDVSIDFRSKNIGNWIIKGSFDQVNYFEHALNKLNLFQVSCYEILMKFYNIFSELGFRIRSCVVWHHQACLYDKNQQWNTRTVLLFVLMLIKPYWAWDQSPSHHNGVQVHINCVSSHHLHSLRVSCKAQDTRWSQAWVQNTYLIQVFVWWKFIKSSQTKCQSCVQYDNEVCRD